MRPAATKYTVLLSGTVKSESTTLSFLLSDYAKPWDQNEMLIWEIELSQISFKISAARNYDAWPEFFILMNREHPSGCLDDILCKSLLKLAAPAACCKKKLVFQRGDYCCNATIFMSIESSARTIDLNAANEHFHTTSSEVDKVTVNIIMLPSVKVEDFGELDVDMIVKLRLVKTVRDPEASLSVEQLFDTDTQKINCLRQGAINWPGLNYLFDKVLDDLPALGYADDILIVTTECLREHLRVAEERFNRLKQNLEAAFRSRLCQSEQQLFGRKLRRLCEILNDNSTFGSHCKKS